MEERFLATIYMRKLLLLETVHAHLMILLLTRTFKRFVPIVSGLNAVLDASTKILHVILVVSCHLVVTKLAHVDRLRHLMRWTLKIEHFVRLLTSLLPAAIVKVLRCHVASQPLADVG